MFETQHIFLPQQLMLDVQEEYRHCGTPLKEDRPDTLLFADPLLHHAAVSIRDALRMGAPELYAETMSQFLALHLLSANSSWQAGDDKRRAGSLSDRRLTRVLEYMDEHYGESVTLDRLAQEAGISRFHFVRLFRERVGATPHRHLINLRMAAAEAMLRQGDLSVVEVAIACGYPNGAHFATNFQRHFAVSPSRYRMNFEREAVRQNAGQRRTAGLQRVD